MRSKCEQMYVSLPDKWTTLLHFDLLLIRFVRMKLLNVMVLFNVFKILNVEITQKKNVIPLKKPSGRAMLSSPTLEQLQGQHNHIEMCDIRC